MTADRPNELYRFVFLSYCWGQMKSVWLKYNAATVQGTGSRPMEIAG